ncbi:MAG: hypothetical protein ABIJ09_14635 [Pseudomonadota bacterium]
MGITLHDGMQSIPLAGKKRLFPTPYSMWSSSAADFSVHNNLEVHNNAAVTGTTTTGALVVNNGLTFTGETAMKGMRVSGVYEAKIISNPADWGQTVNTTMLPTAGSICFLTANSISHNHARPETDVDTSSCFVYAEAGVWKLRAQTMTPWGTTTLSLTCQAHCLSWSW